MPRPSSSFCPMLGTVCCIRPIAGRRWLMRSIAVSGNESTTVALDVANWSAVQAMVERLDDRAVIAIYELAEGAGPVADLAAAQMEKRNLDY